MINESISFVKCAEIVANISLERYYPLLIVLGVLTTLIIFYFIIIFIQSRELKLYKKFLIKIKKMNDFEEFKKELE